MRTVEFGTSPPRSSASVLRRYGVAGLSVVVALVARSSLTRVVGDELPLAFFVIAALVAAWYGGALIGVLALFVGMVLGDYFFVGPKGALGFSNRSEFFQFVRSILISSVGIVLIEILRRGRHRAQLMAEALAQEVARRRQSEAALVEAQSQLSRHAAQLEAQVAERTATLTATVTSLRQLLYHIAHNLRGPARALRGYTTALQEDCGARLDPSLQDYAARISSAANRLQRVIQAVLDYGRLSHVEVRLTDASLEQAIERALQDLAGQIQARKADVKVVGPLPHVRADPEVLAQVMVHLLDNAIKFVPEGTQPRVKVWAEPHDSAVRLWVQDNGIGIEPPYQQRIFGAFERLHTPQTYEGAGIGLAIVQHAMERMDGKVGVLSEAQAGSRFWVEFSRGSVPGQSPAKRALAPPEAGRMA